MLCLFKQRRNGCIEDAATTRNTDPHISLAFPAPKDVRRSIEPIRLALFVAPDAAEPIAPADRFEIRGTSRVAEKQLLEFRQGARKR